MLNLNPANRNKGTTIEPTGTLRNWRLFTGMDGNTYCSGRVYGDVEQRFGDGDIITTSKVIGGPSETGLIHTQYSVYKLEGEGVNDVRPR